MTEVNVNLSKVPNSYVIHLSKGIRGILNNILLKGSIQLSKLEEGKARTSNLLRKMREEVNALKAQINSLEKESILMEEGGQKGSMVQKLLDDKDKEIQDLKKKLKILSS